MNQYKPELNKKIIAVLKHRLTRSDRLTDYSTTREIFNEMVDAYPELIEYKFGTGLYTSVKAAETQILGEISRLLNGGEDRWYIINRDETPNQYSLIVDDSDADDLINEYTNECTTIETIEAKLDNGYIYILDTHLQLDNKDIVKIGKTHDVSKRIKQLDGEQGSYQKHTILYQFKVCRLSKIEGYLHGVLYKGRVNPKKEGFYRDYVEDNIDLIKQMIGMFAID